MDAKCADERSSDLKPGLKQFWKKQLLIPHILLAAVMIGMFRFTNFWDFIIYFVVTGGVVLFTNIVQFDGKVKRILAVTAVQAVEIIVISYVVSLPFTLQLTVCLKVGNCAESFYDPSAADFVGTAGGSDSSADHLYHLGEASWWCEQKSI